MKVFYLSHNQTNVNKNNEIALSTSNVDIQQKDRNIQCWYER